MTWELVRSVRGEEGAVVVQVADAKNLRRALLLTLQLAQLEVPTVLVLNMHDEAEARGIKLDLAGSRRRSASRCAPPWRPAASASRASPRRSLGRARPAKPPADARGRGRPGARAPLRAPRRRPDHPPAFLSRYHEALLGHAGRDHEALRDRRRLRGQGLLAPARARGRPPGLGLADPAGVLYGALRVRGRLRGRHARRPDGEGALPRLPEPVGDRRSSPTCPWAFVRDLFVGRVRPLTMGLSYGLAIVLPIVATFFTCLRPARGLGLPAAARGDERPRVPADGAERQGRAADGARPRLRHHGDAHDADPGDAQGAAARDAAAGARRARARRSSA